uniref:Uncharacterized protein n=1 Tax=Manihot esculenta TaxID=3983 RepID=A0A2C9VUB2_MANES
MEASGKKDKKIFMIFKNLNPIIKSLNHIIIYINIILLMNICNLVKTTKEERGEVCGRKNDARCGVLFHCDC